MNSASATLPRIMREVPVPVLTPALEEAIVKWLDEGPYALSDIRNAAASALRRAGLPHSGSEDYSFIRTGEVLPYLGVPSAPTGARPSASDLAIHILPECAGSHAVLVDGIYVPELSSPGIDFNISLLEDSAPPDSPLPGMHLRFQGLHDAFVAKLAALIETGSDAAASLAALFAAHPLLVRVPAKRTAAAPLQILHVATGASPMKRADALIAIHAGPQSESRILIRHIRLGDKSAAVMENILTAALIEDGASLRILEAGTAEADAGTDIHFRKLAASLDRNARLHAVSAHTGSRLTRNSFRVDLAGEGAEAELNGAVVLTGARQSHNHVRVNHLVPHCDSRQMFKSVAADQSRSSVDGTIVVSLDAQQTNAKQLINNLMLSDEARADSKPRLMIHADDVKCSHGATSGKLDPAQEFYLISRGLPRERARALLTVAFIGEVLEKAGKSGEAFRDGLDHALLDTLRTRMPAAGGAHG